MKLFFEAGNTLRERRYVLLQARRGATLQNIRTRGADATCGDGVVEDLGKDRGRGHRNDSVWGRGRVACVRRSTDCHKIPVGNDLER